LGRVGSGISPEQAPNSWKISRQAAWYGSSRNENGSHNPREDTNIEDFMSGVCVMRKVLAEAAL
jgi:hypothetical protein